MSQPDAAGSADGGARERRRAQVSARLGQLLLGGHTMLADTCEVCSCVLMAAPQGPTACVECELFPPEPATAPHTSAADVKPVEVKTEPPSASPTHAALLDRVPDPTGVNVCLVAGVDIGAELQFTAHCLSAKLRCLAGELRAADDLATVTAVCSGLGTTLDMLAKLKQL